MDEPWREDALVDVVAQVPLFADLPRAVLVEVASGLAAIELAAGELLFAEGDEGHELLIIVAGEVEVRRAVGTPDERQIGRRGPGEFIGELSLLGVDSRRTATVRATRATRLLELGRSALRALLRRYPDLGASMLRVMGERLTAAHTNAIRDLHERNERLSRAYAELQAAQDQLIEKERLERELQVAAEIQRSILPRRMPVLPGFHCEARMVPARVVGGDFYDFIPLGGGALGVAIGDVTDKGVPAAIFMAQARALLRAEAVGAATPREALERVNGHLLQMNDAGLFVTILYGVLEPGGRFSYARAGHELPLVRRATGRVELAPLAQGMALGVVEAPPLDEQTLELAPGEALVLYTDGVSEAQGAAHEEFGVARLREALEVLPGAPAGTLCARILETLARYQADAPQHDDITIVAVERV